MAQTRVFQWSELPAEGAGVLRRDVTGEGASVRQIEIPAGSKADAHSHAHEQFVIVMEGSGTLECDAGSVALRPGTVVHFPPHARHSAAFETRTVLLEVNLAT